MKIAVIGIRGLPANYGGFETCAEHTTSHWVKEGHDVLVYCRKSRYKDRPKTFNGVNLVYTSSIASKSLDTVTHTFFSVLHLIFFKSSYQYIHLYNTGNGFILPLLRLAGKKVIISVDGIEWKRKKWGLIGKSMHKLGALLAKYFTHRIISDNQVVYNFYKEHLHVESSMIAYGAKFITTSHELSAPVLKKYNLKPKEYFLFVGRLVPEKGVHHLIEAYKKLNTNYPLVIIGDDIETPYRNKLFQENCDPIRFLGYIYNDEYEALLSSALLYVSASELEGTSPSLLAAMGAKTCALINGIDENKSTAGDSAFLFKEKNYDDLVLIWQDLIDTPEKIDVMAQKGFEHANSHYRWSTIAKSYIDVFQLA